MRRRALLATLAAGTVGAAGCAALGSDGDQTRTAQPTTATPDETPARTTDHPTDTPAPETPADDPPQPDGHTSLVELETAPLTYAFGPTRLRTDDGANIALWFDRTATAEHPARLRGWLENANGFENTFRIEWIPVVGRSHSRQPRGHSYEATLYAVPTENNQIAETVPTVTQNADGFWYVSDSGSWMSDRHRLDPGERVDLEYALVGHPEMRERPLGTYEFRGRGDTATVTVWETDHPGPESESQFAGRSLPELLDDDTVGWYHEADRGTPVYVQPSTESIELDGLLRFETINHSHEAVGCGHWNLHKLVDGEWYHIAPAIHTADCRSLQPGDRREWQLRAFNGEAVPCGCTSGGCAGGLTKGYLGGGEYAVVAGYGHPEDGSAALVELVGDPVELVPTDDAVVERDGDTVTVTTDRYGDEEHPPDATAALGRVDDADERLLAEQVMAAHGLEGSGDGLRNALAAMAADVDRVLVRADEHVVNHAVGNDEAARRFRFRGEAFEVARVEDGA